MSEYMGYAPVIIAVIAYAVQMGLFVRPVELEKKHREILDDARSEFTTQKQHEDLKDGFKDMKCKIDQMYELLMHDRRGK